MTQGFLALSILFGAVFVMFLGFQFIRVRMILVSAGFFILLTGAFASYANWLPQIRGEDDGKPGGVEGLKGKTVEEIAEMGKEIIFGKNRGIGERSIGKGQCPLCHTFNAGDIGDRAPNLIGIAKRALERVKDPRYLKPDFVQLESFAGSGRATTATEYIAESHACPSCFVVEGFGVPGTKDKESPMMVVHKPPIGLTINELIAVDTWLFFREGFDPPSVAEIQAAYEKFIPPPERPKDGADGVAVKTRFNPDQIAHDSDSTLDMIERMGCAGCHRIPTVDFAKIGVVGPLLIEGENAARRIVSPEYQEAIQKGTAHARNPREYVIESIMNPSSFIVPGFPAQKGGKSLMPDHFSKRFTYSAAEKLADFLLSLDKETAIQQGVDRLPNEKEGTLFPEKEMKDRVSGTPDKSGSPGPA
ncbi:MAG TPA: nitric oxide reductase [Nitrospiria bacterium]|jgi:hypothetical protein